MKEFLAYLVTEPIDIALAFYFAAVAFILGNFIGVPVIASIVAFFYVIACIKISNGIDFLNAKLGGFINERFGKGL